jgi:hypothetical protein
MLGLILSIDRVNFSRLAMIAPLLGLTIAADGLVTGRLPEAPVDPGRVRITVYTQPDCPYCDEFRESVMPGIDREFGSRVAVEYRPADDLPAVRRTPTIILRPARSGGAPRVIEGMPSPERLRGVIRELEAP